MLNDGSDQITKRNSELIDSSPTFLKMTDIFGGMWLLSFVADVDVSLCVSSACLFSLLKQNRKGRWSPRACAKASNRKLRHDQVPGKTTRLPGCAVCIPQLPPDRHTTHRNSYIIRLFIVEIGNNLWYNFKRWNDVYYTSRPKLNVMTIMAI